jgi:hypothetical protein
MYCGCYFFPSVDLFPGKSISWVLSALLPYIDSGNYTTGRVYDE